MSAAWVGRPAVAAEARAAGPRHRESLLRREDGDPDPARAGGVGAPRFTMLRTVRAYALERLAASGEAEELGRRHGNRAATGRRNGDPGRVGRPGPHHHLRLRAIRLDNTTANSITVQAVTMTIHNSSEVFNLWGSFTIPPNESAILAQTNGEYFDTHDFPVGGSVIGATCQQPADATNHPPTVSVQLADGTQATATDTGHILDTGGIDQANACRLNESLAWRAIGTMGISSTTANLILTASAAISFPVVNTPATIVANLKDAANILPLANVTARFAVLSGPNAGLSGQGLTDSQGNTTFTYTSTVACTDVLQASVTNATTGAFYSNPVTLTWTTPGALAWHPHQTVRLSDGLSAAVDLYDDHVDVAVDALSLPARGPDLALDHVWDSDFARTGLTTSVGQGWLSSQAPRMGGVLTGTVLYTDTSGAVWPFSYS